MTIKDSKENSFPKLSEMDKQESLKNLRAFLEATKKAEAARDKEKDLPDKEK